MAAATPVERDRFADLLRVASILTVVAGHWLMAVVTWRDGRVAARWPLPGPAAELAGLRISPGAGLLCLGAGVVLLGRGRLEG